MTRDRALVAIREARARLGEKLLILAHHYQHDDIVAQADFVGDSLELARRAAGVDEARYIAFCGVYFMAETASILAQGKTVLIPDTRAGCPLADSAPVADVERAWDVVTRLGPSVIPVTYVNSSAALKAFCGERGGAVCTSANAAKVISWALRKSGRVFFMPDMNLGLNTSRALGIEPDRVALWDRGRELGGLDEKALERSRVILWKGWCPVHYPAFTASDVHETRRRLGDIRIVVHPETSPDTVEAAGETGSTSRMLSLLQDLPTGTTIALGTEATMVNRASRDMQSRIRVVALREVYCEDMARITPEALARVLEDPEGEEHRVVVPADIARSALKALDIMLGL